MSGNVRPRNTPGNYAGRDPVTILVDAFGWTRATAEQRLKFSDDRNPAPMLAAMVGALNAGGRPDVSEKLCLPLDVVRRHVRPTLTLERWAESDSKDFREDLDSNALRLIDPTLALDTPEAITTALRVAKSKEDAALADLEIAAAIRAACARAEGQQ